MDIDKYLEPEFDFSRLFPDELDMIGVTEDEVIDAFKNASTKMLPDWQYPFQANRWFGIGFSGRSQCLEMLIGFNSDSNKFIFLTVNLANEYGIKILWCRQRRLS
jgi:hypothetical protein